MGSFGVPIKSEAARSVDIDPLVFQTYKTFVCFATSWLILLTGETFTFSPWGIVSGLFWVPGYDDKQSCIQHLIELNFCCARAVDAHCIFFIYDFLVVVFSVELRQLTLLKLQDLVSEFQYLLLVLY